MKVHVAIPTTRIVWGTTTYEVEIDGTEADIRAEFDADPAAFVERYAVTEHDIEEEFDNESETTDFKPDRAEIVRVKP